MGFWRLHGAGIAEFAFLFALWVIAAAAQVILPPAPFSVSIALVTLGVCSVPFFAQKSRQPILDRQILLLLLGFAGGLWLFRLFDVFGAVVWPFGRSASPQQLLFLLYSHLVLIAKLAASVIGIAGAPYVLTSLRWGHWRGHRLPVALSFVPVLVFAVWTIASSPSNVHRPLFLLLPVLIVKACLTGFGEEAFYRGLLQHAAISRFGIAWGIVFQALCYAAFHIWLMQGFGAQSLFIASLFGLGALLGLMTYKTRGIGWAAVIHIGLDTVIEWHNIS